MRSGKPAESILLIAISESALPHRKPVPRKEKEDGIISLFDGRDAPPRKEALTVVRAISDTTRIQFDASDLVLARTDDLLEICAVPTARKPWNKPRERRDISGENQDSGD